MSDVVWFSFSFTCCSLPPHTPAFSALSPTQTYEASPFSQSMTKHKFVQNELQISKLNIKINRHNIIEETLEIIERGFRRSC